MKFRSSYTVQLSYLKGEGEHDKTFILHMVNSPTLWQNYVNVHASKTRFKESLYVQNIESLTYFRLKEISTAPVQSTVLGTRSLMNE